MPPGGRTIQPGSTRIHTISRRIRRSRSDSESPDAHIERLIRSSDHHQALDAIAAARGAGLGRFLVAARGSPEDGEEALQALRDILSGLDPALRWCRGADVVNHVCPSLCAGRLRRATDQTSGLGLRPKPRPPLAGLALRRTIGRIKMEAPKHWKVARQLAASPCTQTS